MAELGLLDFGNTDLLLLVRRGFLDAHLAQEVVDRGIADITFGILPLLLLDKLWLLQVCFRVEIVFFRKSDYLILSTRLLVLKVIFQMISNLVFGEQIPLQLLYWVSKAKGLVEGDRVVVIFVGELLVILAISRLPLHVCEPIAMGHRVHFLIIVLSPHRNFVNTRSVHL